MLAGNSLSRGLKSARRPCPPGGEMKITLEEAMDPDYRIGPSNYPDAVEVLAAEVERLTKDLVKWKDHVLHVDSLNEAHVIEIEKLTKPWSDTYGVAFQAGRADERAPMECGHPRACMRTDDNLDEHMEAMSFCRWCADAALNAEERAPACKQVEVEREACAKIAYEDTESSGTWIARKIRARATEPKGGGSK